MTMNTLVKNTQIYHNENSMTDIRKISWNMKQQGQVLLITILVLTVATTIALSLIGRATLDFSMSNQVEESTRAFDAAEAGVESALKTGVGSSATIATGTRYNVTVNNIGGASGVFQMAHKTATGATETLWLVNHTALGALDETPFYQNNTINVCWSKESVPSALVIGVLYKKGTDGSYNLARLALDPNSAVRGNNFDSLVTTTNGCGLGNYYEKQVDFTALGITPIGASADTLLALRIRPEYSDTTIAVDGGITGVPKQGNQIESTGTTGAGVSRKVVVYQQYRSPATIFDSVIYSQSSFGH